MLLRNVNLYDGLANGTRLKLKEVSNSGKVMKVEIMTGPRAAKKDNGQYVYPQNEREYPLFKIPCSNENDKTIKMIRKQFPVRLTYCMSINKSQGQTLQRVGLYLPNPVFSHGQLYVALSRVSRPDSITVFIDGSNDKHGKLSHDHPYVYTKNRVYGQLLREEIAKFKASENENTQVKYLGEYPCFDNMVESDDEDFYQHHMFEEPDFEEPDFEPDFEEPAMVCDAPTRFA